VARPSRKTCFTPSLVESPGRSRPRGHQQVLDRRAFVGLEVGDEFVLEALDADEAVVDR
jgi:hypothetical protein